MEVWGPEKRRVQDWIRVADAKSRVFSDRDIYIPNYLGGDGEWVHAEGGNYWRVRTGDDARLPRDVPASEHLGRTRLLSGVGHH